MIYARNKFTIRFKYDPAQCLSKLPRSDLTIIAIQTNQNLKTHTHTHTHTEVSKKEYNNIQPRKEVVPGCVCEIVIPLASIVRLKH
jgi:lipid II:glycine glycyltransferase (peptidoglycan interpeptide bridge formation enzyme)